MKDETTVCPPSGELEELRREVAYLRRLSGQTIAKMLQLDAESISIRHELEQKRRGFKLMAELAGSLGKHVDHTSLFVAVSRRLNAALGMQRTAVLTPGPDGLFNPAVLQGYSPEEEAALAVCSLELPPEFLRPDLPVLITGVDGADRFASLRETLGLPFLIASPVFLQNVPVAVLITGRLLEQQPYMPPLGRSDVETVQTVASHLATLLAARLLVEDEQRTKIMLDAMPHCCNFWDENHNNIDCNEAAARLFELGSKVEYLERFNELSPEYQPCGRLSAELAAERIHEAFTEGYCRFEWMHQKLNGEPVPAEITLVRVRWGKGFIVVGYTRDLREQRAMQTAVERTQRELLKARDVAEKSARAKSEFLANMSHEIRTPMNAVLGMTYLLGRTDLTEKQRGYLNQTEHSANLLLRVINDILDFSKLDAGKMHLETVEFSLRKLMRNVHDIVRAEADAKSLHLYSNIDDAAVDALIGDPSRLEQVLLNFTSNAIKFTPSRGKVSVRVRQQSLSPDRAELQFTVQDTGIGMTPEQVANLFLPFSQVDTSSTRRYGGTGLGLAVSRCLVELMGGAISCSSHEGEGSSFTFVLTLPLANKAKSADDGSGETGDDAGSLRGMRVLLAEDNEINQMIAQELLAAKGVVVGTVATGQEALNVLAEESFDLVLMDIQMPEMDGLTATMCIRTNPLHKDLPIIAMTAHAMSGDRETSLKSGMNDHLTKPIDPELLYAALRRWDMRSRA
ncbi:putative Histidine kinase [uncultured delta proteobacterium]|uniref:Sensory/regulatory protein RpfC n=1 Tax=uncultured delta proteobacterium TaxID=34034 RepID=A0A212IY18_9DELT|nr:putative Histidine kinase [uncultured delta proteobacterium]